MIANDGNILEHAVAFDGRDQGIGNPIDWKGQLPSQTIAERYDIIVDFSKFPVGAKLYFVNIMEHQDGKGTKSKVPIADILSERYHPVVQNGRWINGDPGVGKFMELRVKTMVGVPLDQSMDPALYEPGGLQMLPLPIVRGARTINTTVNGVPVATATHHTFDYVHSQGNGGHGAPWMIKVDGGTPNLMNPHRVQAIEKGELQVWAIKGTGGWTHPVHIHFEEGILLSRGGKAPPAWELWGKKDMYRIGPENDSTGFIEFAYRSRDFLGEYVQHCHNTMHEDHSMLLRWDSSKNGTILLDTPMPTFDGVSFEPSFALTDPATVNVLVDGVLVPTTTSNSKAITGDGIGPKDIRY
jgi:FtsP/CotA-like multicopper oxidase with cupredoxin domain